MLGIQFDAELADQIELGLEEVDVALLVLHQFLEQVAADVILDRLAIGRRLRRDYARLVMQPDSKIKLNQ